MPLYGHTSFTIKLNYFLTITPKVFANINA